MANHILSIILFTPLLGAFIVLLLPKDNKNAIRWVANIFAALGLLVSVPLVPMFWAVKGEAGFHGFHFIEGGPNNWIPTIGAGYYLGIDGVSFLLIMLTTILGWISILSSWNAIQDRVKEYYAWFLILQTGMLGVFMALDLFFFFVFWEAMLVPMYLLIGIWGGPRKLYAAIKFFLYTLFGSVLMLLGILVLYFSYHTQFGTYSFDIRQLISLSLPLSTQIWVFLAFFVGFAIKVPMFPFHTWLPDAHVEAPTAGSVILAGVLLKMGTYGFIRFNLPLFPQAAHDYAPLLIVLALVGIIYGAIVSIVQKDIKSLVAFSSVSHLGFVMLGLFAFNAQGMSGSILQMVNHGLSTGALFLLVGMLYERRHTRLIADFGGIAKVMPIYAAFFLVVMFSSLGLPGLNGFVGEFLILAGAFQANVWYAVFAATGVVLSAIYLLWMYQRAIAGPVTNDANKSLPDLSPREIALLVALVIFIIWIGVYPSTFLNPMQASVSNLLAIVK